MDCIVCSKCGGYQEFGVENPAFAFFDVERSQRIHVMNQKFIADFVTQYTQIAALIPEDNYLTGLFPLSGGVELLIDPPIEPKRVYSDTSLENQVMKPILERF